MSNDERPTDGNPALQPGNPAPQPGTHPATRQPGLRRLAFQLEAATGSLRCPFGIDDGSKFSGKPSLNIELPSEQRAFFQGELEAKVKDAAAEHKAVWFGIGAISRHKPSDDDVRKSFTPNFVCRACRRHRHRHRDLSALHPAPRDGPNV